MHLSSSGARGALLVANAVGVSASTVFSVVGLVRPGFVQPGSSSSSLTQFWAASSAVRTWAVTGPVLVGLARGGRSAPQLLAVAGIVQLFDAALGVWQRNRPMTVLPAAVGVLHLASARRLSRLDR